MDSEPDDAFKAAFDFRVCEALQTNETPPDDVNLFDAGLDSAAFVQLMMDLEDEFGGFWPLEQLTSLADLALMGSLRTVSWDALRNRAT